MAVKPRNKWLIMGLLGLAQFVVVLDATITNVALPSMQRALNITPENLQWIITAYTLAFGGFLMLGGRAADILGRKKIFVIGTIGFSLASLGVGLAQSEAIVIVARGIQGLAGAFMSPAALAIILATFAEGNERNKALSIWGGIASSGAAAGLLLGGVLTQYLNWRWNFFVNVPVGLLVAFATTRIIPESKADLGHKTFDVVGAATVTGGLMLLVYGLSKAPQYGWGDTRSLLMLGIAVLILVIFLFNEARSKHPLIPLKFFAIKNVGKANLVMFPIVAAMFSMFFFLTLYVQNVLGYQPVRTGFAFLPIAIVIGMVAGVAANLVKRVGYKPLMVAGAVFVSIALFWLGHLPVEGEYFKHIFPPLVVMAAGMGLAFISVTIAATTGVPLRDSGLASGLLNTTQQVGGAIGLALLSTVSASATKHFLENLSAAPTDSDKVTALVQGFHWAFYFGSGMAAFAALTALVLIKQKKGEKVAFDPAAAV